MCPSIWPIPATPRPTTIIVMKPLEASATTIAMPMAVGAPIMGMKAPMNTSTARGAANGIPTSCKKIPAMTASVSATSTVPRA